MAGATIGSLNVDLSIGTARFKKGVDEAQRKIDSMQSKFASAGKKLTTAGVALTAGITAPFTALVASAIPAAVESQQALAQVEAALKSMGPVSGRTTEQLQAMAGKLQDISNFDDDDILKSVTANLLTFGNVSGEVFDRAQLAAVNLSARLGQDLQSSAIQLGKALNDPLKGVTALQKIGVSFTATQKEQIKNFVATGNVAAAQSLILGELEKQYGGAAKAQRDATPDAALQQQWRTFQEVIGGIALKVLPPLTSGLEGVLKAFNGLDPAVQSLVLGGAAIAAAIGPVSVVLGGLTTVAGPLLARLALMSGATGFAALAPILGPLALAVGAVVIAWKNWDTIGPYIDGVVTRTSEAAAEIDTKLGTIQTAADDFDKRWGIPSKTDFIDGAKTAVINSANAIDAALARVQTFADNFDAAIATAFRNAVSSATALYSGVKTWLQDKLGGVLDWVSQKAKAVGDAFFTLYDRVVGHSYVPDMVDEIGTNMARLEGNLVAPAQRATDAAAQAFAALKSSVGGSTLALGEGYSLSADVQDTADKLGGIDLTGGKGFNGAIDLAQQMRSVLGDLGTTAGGVFGDIANILLTSVTPAIGTASNALSQMQSITSSLGGLFGSLFGKIFGKKAGGIIGGILDVGIKAFGGARARGGPVSGGKSYLVGESGPELFRPNGSGSIVSNDNLGMGRLIVEASPYFDVRAASAARPETQAMGVKAAAGGAQIAQTRANRAARRRLS